ncbi:hypothetical protein PINS_up019527 [Pythium insidiosum]|nr:hypothetical protein PINS_up004339 [Pythium insidiosum]GLE08366.1 hypothetical protein PINS_up019527 [Pythium insidiosum]
MRHILVTGGNAGLGFECCKALVQKPNTHVIVAGRSASRVDAAVQELQRVAAASTTTERAIVDLSSLQSVKTLCDDLLQREVTFDCVVCNAGVQMAALQRTPDGFEMTVGTNHIAHFLLIKLLMPRTKRVLVLSSETHNPQETSLPKPNVSNLDEMARGYAKFNALEAYTTSKLCNLLFAKELARRYRGKMEALAYTPGFTPGTSLFRNNNRFLWAIVRPILTLILKLRGARVSTPAYSGGYMARIASAESWSSEGWSSGDYIRVDEVYPASSQANDEALAKALWDKTEEWVKPFTPTAK